MATLAVRRLSSDAKTFVAFMLRYFGTSRVRELDARTDNSRWQYVTSEVVRIAHHGDYEQVPTSFEMPAYYLSWVLNSGRVNGATHLAIRQMDARAILQLIAAIRDRKLHGNEVARFLMDLQQEGSR
jgi:hypothetical protein